MADFDEYNDPDLWIDLCEIKDIMVRFPHYIKCPDEATAYQICSNFDAHFEDQDWFQVCRKYDYYVFFETEEAKSLALIIN